MDSPNLKIDNYTEGDLNKVYWWVTHKLLIYKILTIALEAACALIWLFVIWGLVKFFLLEWNPALEAENALTAQYINYDYLGKKGAPQKLVYQSTEVFQLGNARSDFVTMVTNPNTNWYAESVKYSYNFTGRKAEAAVKETFILPGQTKYLIDLGVNDANTSDVSLVINDVKWRRINNIKAYEDFQDKALNLVVSDIKFTAPRNPSGGGGSPVSHTRFSVKNNSPFNYWDVGFYIMLFNGSNIEAANYIVQGDFNSGETKNIEIAWFQPISGVGETEILPDINILDPIVFRRVDAGSGELK